MVLRSGDRCRERSVCEFRERAGIRDISFGAGRITEKATYDLNFN